jgi:hypothetical protein
MASAMISWFLLTFAILVTAIVALVYSVQALNLSTINVGTIQQLQQEWQ